MHNKIFEIKYIILKKKGKCGIFWKKKGFEKTNFNDKIALQKIKNAI